jgi:hypothetical protein
MHMTKTLIRLLAVRVMTDFADVASGPWIPLDAESRSSTH